MKRKLIGVFSLSLVLFLSSCSGGYRQSKMSERQLLDSLAIYEGVTINGERMAGKSRLTAEEDLKAKLEPKLTDVEISMVSGDEKFTYTLKDLGYKYDYSKVTNEAYNLGREGSDEERLAKIEEIKKDRPDFKLELTRDQEVFDSVVDEIDSVISIPSTFEGYAFDKETEKVYALVGEDGLEVDKEKLVADIESLADKGGEVEIRLVETSRNRDAEEIAAGVDGVIGEAESYFDAGYWERAENIRVSSEELDGVVINPGESFSFNDFIGDTTYNKGYHQTIVLSGVEEVPGMGGGVCQTSTALYQALLKADLDIVERHPHTWKLNYHEGGLDAAVDYGIIDLVMVNNFDFPVVIRTYYEPGYIDFKILGDTSKKNYDISLVSYQSYTSESSTIYKYDPDLGPDEEVYETWGHSGSGWTAYKRNESTGEEEYINETHYPPVDSVVRKGS